MLRAASAEGSNRNGESVVMVLGFAFFAIFVR
jgi:hypothetical protein